MDLAKDIKDLQRFKTILITFFDEGFGYYLLKTNLAEHLPFHKRVLTLQSPATLQKQAKSLRRALEKLGPTFVKLGQLLSLRPDLVPPEYSKELEQLQDHVPPFPFSDVKSIIEKDLGKKISEVFPTFERKPFASASIAQVHRATLQNGTIVAVKVQRPQIKEIIDEDLDIMFFIAEQLEKHSALLRHYHPVEVVKEFALWTRRELDFQLEAHNAQRLKQEMKDNHHVKVAQIYPQYSSKRVLVMEFVEGKKIDDLVALEAYHLRREKIAQIYFTSILQQALVYGLFHADPHPANIFVNKKGQLVYLDYGIMGELLPEDRQKIIQFIIAAEAGDAQKGLQCILSLARKVDSTDLQEFQEKVLEIMKEVYSHGIGQTSPGKALYKIIALGARYGVTFDPSHVLMAKAVYQSEGLAVKLDPKFKVAEGLHEFARQFLVQEYSPQKILTKAKTAVWKHRDLLLDLPEHLVKIIRRLEQQPPQHCEKEHLQEIEERFEEVSRHRSFGLMVLVLLLASFFFLYLEGRTTIAGLPLSGILFFCTALVMLYFFISHKKHQWRFEQ